MMNTVTEISRRAALAAAALSAATASLAGCHAPPYGVTVGEKNDAVRIVRAEQAATYSATVVAVSKWADVEKQLQPAFKIDEASAQLQVLPLTSREDALRARTRSVEVALGLSSGVAAGESSRTVTSTKPIDPLTGKPVVGPDGEVGSREVVNSTSGTSAPTEAPAVASPAAAAALALAAEAPALGVEPQLKYNLAYGLMTHVRLLNRQITDSVRRDGYVPYVVTLKLTTQPLRPDLPLDVYYDVAFFGVDEVRRDPAAGLAGAAAAAAAVPASSPAAPVAAGPRKSPALWNWLSLRAPRDLAKQDTGTRLLPQDAPAQVIPLLSNDSMEGQLRSLEDRDVFSSALALSAMFQQVGAKVSAADLREELRHRFGRRSNSLLSVVKLSGNTLRIRVGSALSPEDKSNTAMATRENVISLVVLLPQTPLTEQGKRVVLAARPHLRDARNGKRLDSGADADVYPYTLARVVNVVNGLPAFDAGLARADGRAPSDAERRDRAAGPARAMMSDASQGLQEAFLDRLEALCGWAPNVKQVAEWWLMALGAYDGPFYIDTFEIDNSRPASWPGLLPADGTTTPTLADGGKDLVLTLSNGNHLDAMKDPIATIQVGGVPVRATSVAAVDGGHGLKAVFPPLAGWPRPVTRPSADLPSADGWVGTVQVDFLPPVPFSDPVPPTSLPAPFAPSGADKVPITVPAGLTHLPNGRLRMTQAGVAYVKVGDGKSEKELAVTADQSVLRVNRDARSDLTLRVANLPPPADKPTYLRLRNARVADVPARGNASPPLLNLTGTGHWQIVGNGAIIVTVDNATPAVPVVVETYGLDDGVEKGAKQQLTLSVTN